MNPADLLSAMKRTVEQLAAFKRPRLLHFVESLPRNALGKVVKHELAVNHARSRTDSPR